MVATDTGAAMAWVRRLVRRLGVDMRAGEGPTALLLFLCFFLFLTFQYTAKTVRQSTFIDALGATKLPYVYLLVAVCSYPVLRLYIRFSDRLGRHQLIAATCSVVGFSMMLFWWLYQYPWPWVPFVFYIWVSIAFVMTVSQFWSLANHVFDPRQAKRLFGFIGAGGLLGGIAGGQVARLVTGMVGTRYALLVAAAIILSVAGLMYLIHRLSPTDDAAVAGASGLGKLDKARGGFEVIRQSRHLQLIAAVLTLTVVVAQIVDLQFNWAVEASTQTLDQRTSFYGNFFTIMGIAAFLFQLAFTSRIHRTLGVGVAMRVLPTSMTVGTLWLFVAAGFFPGILIGAALVLKVGEAGLRYSLDQATRELLYLPVPSKARIKAKAFIDVFIQRGAKGLAALLLLPVTFAIITPVQAGWISLPLIALWLGVTVAMHREYVRSFRHGLKERTVETGASINVSDVTTLEILVESLGSPDPNQVLQSMELLASSGRANLVSPLLLYHDNPLVRRRTLQILVDAGRPDAALLIERRLGDDDLDVRAAAIQALSHFDQRNASELMLPRLKEADPGIRGAAVACLINQGDDDSVEEAERVLGDMLADADPAVRQEGTKAIGAVREPKLQAQLVRLLYDPSPDVVREAIASVGRRVERDGFVPLYAPTLISLLKNRRLKHETREALVSLGEEVLPALVYFMKDPEEQIWVRRALPKTIARIGTPGATQALVESLDGPDDALLRRKMIEAAGALGLGAFDHAQRTLVEKAAARESQRYLGTLAELDAIGFGERGRLEGPLVRWDDDESPSLLEQLLAERASNNLDNLFGLLALTNPPDNVWASHRSLISGQAALRNHALEYLDNTLSGDLRRNVMAVIDDTSLREKLRRAEKLFGIRGRSKAATLRDLLAANGDGNHDAAAFTAAALYAVYTDRVSELYPRVAELTDAENGFVSETAEWVARRLELQGA